MPFPLLNLVRGLSIRSFILMLPAFDDRQVPTADMVREHRTPIRLLSLCLVRVVSVSVTAVVVFTTRAPSPTEALWPERGLWGSRWSVLVRLGRCGSLPRRTVFVDRFLALAWLRVDRKFQDVLFVLVWFSRCDAVCVVRCFCGWCCRGRSVMCYDWLSSWIRRALCVWDLIVGEC